MQQSVSAKGWATSVSLLVIVGSCLAVFGQTLTFSFLLLDDPGNITENPHFNNGIQGVVAFWKSPYDGLYAPLTYTTWAIEAAVSRASGLTSADGLSPVLFHAGNVFLHCCASVLVFVLFRLLGLRHVAATVSALLFALHPLHVESVAWVTETKGLLAGTFSLAAICVYLNWLQKTPEGRRQSIFPYACATTLFLLALLSKPSAVVTPLIIVVIEYGWLRRPFLASTFRMMPWFFCALVFVVVTKILQGDEMIGWVTPWLARPLIVADSIGFYLQKTVLPISLAPDYGRIPAKVLAHRQLYSAFVVLLLTAVFIALAKPRRTAMVGLVLFIVALLPTVGLIPFVFQTYSTVADRYAYLAMLGPALLLGAFVQKRPSRPRTVMAGVLLVACTVMTLQQLSYWKNDGRLWTMTVRRNPESFMSWSMLGDLELRENNLAKAKEHYSQAIKINDNYATAYRGLAIAHYEQGELTAALNAIEMALQIAPNRAELWHIAAVISREAGLSEQSQRQLENALFIDPTFESTFDKR